MEHIRRRDRRRQRFEADIHGAQLVGDTDTGEGPVRRSVRESFIDRLKRREPKRGWL